MKLDFRDFYYLDSKTVDNLYGHVSGFIQEDHLEIDTDENIKKGSGGFKYGVEASIGKDTRSEKEISRRGKVNTELRYKHLMDILKEQGLEQIDFLESADWTKYIGEEEYIELRGSLHFTEVYELEKQANFIGGIGMSLNEFFGKNDSFNEAEVQKVLYQIGKVRELQEKNGIPIKFKTFDKKYTFVAYLNDDFLVKEQKDVIGNDYKMLCKVERKIEEGKDYDLFDIEEIEKKLLSREERRKRKDNSLRGEFKEKVKGPAAIVSPIAIYR